MNMEREIRTDDRYLTLIFLVQYSIFDSFLLDSEFWLLASLNNLTL
jgi:hypothetical protein